MTPQIFRVGVKAVFVCRGELLVLHGPGKRYWDLPGGRIEPGESIKGALRREIAEELPDAQEVRIGSILGAAPARGIEFSDGSALMLLLYEAAALFPLEPLRAGSTEHTEIRWVALEQARKMGPLVAAAADLTSRSVASTSKPEVQA